MSHPHRPGRHELGQNFLTDPRVIAHVVRLAAASRGPLVEWGTGDGALTRPLGELGRPLEGVEIDPERAARQRHRVGPDVTITEGDLLRHAPPRGSTVVGNVPFHITTPVLRHLFRRHGWHRAVLIVQWEVARKRAGVGGATRMTAAVWPWFEMRLEARVPARAFRPVPSVDGGILVIERRRRPLLPQGDAGAYRAFVGRVFTGRGHGVRDILARTGWGSRTAAADACAQLGISPRALPRDLDARQWAGLFSGRPGGPPRGSAR
ncbi:23S ribosomal RNA methyltransferase Erm [Brachybacterium sp. AOP25-B2-12]|uniref:23S ribosomal RNA methyltransferase Erm n=1 Tax=Brachybacterium sp. AOP25-B2-12 TaxID=3457710 RepID=UPI0040344ECF